MECFLWSVSGKKYAPFKGYDFGKNGDPDCETRVVLPCFRATEDPFQWGNTLKRGPSTVHHTPPSQQRKTQLIAVNAVIGSSNARWCDGGKIKVKRVLSTVCLCKGNRPCEGNFWKPVHNDASSVGVSLENKNIGNGSRIYIHTLLHKKSC